MTDFDFLKKAYEIASTWSTDPSTQNGAVLVRDGLVVASGANHFPSGVVYSPDRWERPAKYQYVEHAERNVIYDAASRGVATAGTVMYCPWYACSDCARAIIQAGVVEVVGHDTELHKRSPHWQDSIRVAYQMLEEAGVKMRHAAGYFGVVIRFNGEEVEV
jgi:dCMP deaminase